MVDVEVTTRAQQALNTQIAKNPAAQAQAAQQMKSQTVADELDLSTSAKRLMKELTEGQTIAEAYLKHQVDSATDVRQTEASNKSGFGDEKDDEKHRRLQDAFDRTMTDIGWLVEALTKEKIDTTRINEAVSARGRLDGIAVRPPIAEVIIRAEQNDSVAALFVEDLSVTIKDSGVSDVSVRRVSLTSVHKSMHDRIVDNQQPLVLDVGGQLQGVAAVPLSQNAPLSKAEEDPVLPYERQFQSETDHGIDSFNRGTRSDDPRHALLIVREGGRVQNDRTLHLRIDAIRPI